MTTQHRATPEQWASIEHWGTVPPESGGAVDSCLLELRARVEALETGATCSHIVTSDEGTSYCRLAEQASAMDELRAASAEARPGGLVERVADAIYSNGTGDGFREEARAAIRTVTAWLRTGRLLHAAELMELEANR